MLKKHATSRTTTTRRHSFGARETAAASRVRHKASRFNDKRAGQLLIGASHFVALNAKPSGSPNRVSSWQLPTNISAVFNGECNGSTNEAISENVSEIRRNSIRKVTNRLADWRERTRLESLESRPEPCLTMDDHHAHELALGFTMKHCISYMTGSCVETIVTGDCMQCIRYW